MAKFNYNLRSPGILSVCPIYLIIRYQNQKLVYPTEERIPPEFWNKPAQRAKVSKSYPEATYLNERLDFIDLEAKRAFRRYMLDNQQRYPTISELRKELDISLRKRQNLKGLSFFGFIEKYIEEASFRTNSKSGKSISRATIQIYKHTFELLKEYAKARRKSINFRDVDLDFYYDFVDFVKESRKLSNNTIGKHIRTIKVFLNDATERGLNESNAYRSRKFQISGEYIEKVYLTELELSDLSKLDLNNNKKLDRVRDLFLVGCWTGLRFSDLATLTRGNISGENFKIRTQKTDEHVVIPIHPVVHEILKKYEGHKNMLPNIISNAKMNVYLKEVMALVPTVNRDIDQKIIKDGILTTVKRKKSELITVHTARRSFATNLYLSKFPTVSIMKITGHRTESSFMEYIKITPTENADLLKQHWEKQAKEINEVKKKRFSKK